MKLDLAPLGLESNVVALFSESQSRFVVTASQANAAAFEAQMAGHACTRLGAVTPEERLVILCGNGAKVDASLAELKEAWQRPLRW